MGFFIDFHFYGVFYRLSEIRVVFFGEALKIRFSSIKRIT